MQSQLSGSRWASRQKTLSAASIGLMTFVNVTLPRTRECLRSFCRAGMLHTYAGAASVPDTPSCTRRQGPGLGNMPSLGHPGQGRFTSGNLSNQVQVRKQRSSAHLHGHHVRNCCRACTYRTRAAGASRSVCMRQHNSEVCMRERVIPEASRLLRCSSSSGSSTGKRRGTAACPAPRCWR